jgi:hypothetical protein
MGSQANKPHNKQMLYKNEFITIQDINGDYRPQAFITRHNSVGLERARQVKLEEGDVLVIVEFVKKDEIK